MCNTRKPFEEFNKDSRRKDGRQGKCKECSKKLNADRYLNKKEHIKKLNLKWKSENRDKVNEIQRRYIFNNLEKVRQRFISWAENNKDYNNYRCVEWKSENKERVAYYNSNRRSIKNNASLNNSFKQEIKEVYLNRKDGYEVDHIIPLSNKSVCGLHVPWNLQLITIEENRKKSNNFDFTNENNSWKKED